MSFCVDVGIWPLLIAAGIGAGVVAFFLVLSAGREFFTVYKEVERHKASTIGELRSRNDDYKPIRKDYELGKERPLTERLTRRVMDKKYRERD